jgi:ferredoxin
MKVWIDQSLCTGDGRCEVFAPAPSGWMRGKPW